MMELFTLGNKRDIIFHCSFKEMLRFFGQETTDINMKETTHRGFDKASHTKSIKEISAQ